MILVYEAEGKQLDVVTITNDSISYATGRARSFFETALERFGRAGTMLAYRDWSNGYVKISEKVPS